MVKKGYKKLQCEKIGIKLSEEIGKVVAEKMLLENNELRESYKNKYNITLKENVNLSTHKRTLKEDITTSNSSGAYTTMLSDTLYYAALDEMQDILNLVFVNEDMVNVKGHGSYQVPRLEPTIAVVVAEGAEPERFSEGITAFTATPQKVITGTGITWEMSNRSMPDFVRMVLLGAADGIKRKLSSDILNGLSIGAGQTQTGGLTYANLIDAEAKVKSAKSSLGVPYGFSPTHLVLTPTGYATLAKTTEWKTHVYHEGMIASAAIPTINMPQLMFSSMKILQSDFLSHSLGLIIDSKKAGILLKESNLEVYEGRISGRLYDSEIVSLMSYAIVTLYSLAICKITA